MSVASTAVVLLGELAIKGVVAYSQAKAAAQQAMNDADRAKVAEIDQRLAGEVVGNDAADKRLNDDIDKAT